MSGMSSSPSDLLVVGDAGELARPEPAATAVGPGDVLYADVARHRVERHPEAHFLFAVDAVV